MLVFQYFILTIFVVNVGAFLSKSLKHAGSSQIRFHRQPKMSMDEGLQGQQNSAT
jgi:hypothetical protein